MHSRFATVFRQTARRSFHSSAHARAYEDVCVRASALNIDDPNLRILDCGGPDAYTRAHIPGAVPVTPSATKHFDGVHVCVPESMRALAREWGIGKDTRVVVYDSGGITGAARVWWTLRYFGHKNCYLLDGGFPAYLHAGLRASARMDARMSADGTPFEPVPQREGWFAAASDVMKVVGGGGERCGLLDVRTSPEYTGDEVRGTRRGGHVPGARNIPFREFLAEDGTFKSPDAILALLAQTGIDAKAPVISYCLGGVRAAVGLAALKVAGVASVRNYDASMGEWLNNPEFPVEKGQPARR